MQASFAPIRHKGFSYSKVLLCALLACLFLYNPFQAVSHDHGNLAVCHPASYRATVASSEMEQFAPPTMGADTLVAELDVVERLPLNLATNGIQLRHAFAFPEEVTASPQAGFSSSLWFRPPPSA